LKELQLQEVGCCVEMEAEKAVSPLALCGDDGGGGVCEQKRSFAQEEM